MTENRLRIGGLLIAAGGSSRFGSPKQLAEFQGESLIRRAAKALIEASCDPVVAVVGAEIEHSVLQLADLRLKAEINADWKTGMSSSIIAGLKSLESCRPDVDGVLITLCDQPLITVEHLRSFIVAFDKTKAPIVAADYGDFYGVPALFSRERFQDLYRLTGDKGAREIIRTERYLSSVPIGPAGLDIDSPEQLHGIAA